MKKSIIFSLCSLVLVFAACRKSDNAKLPDLSRVPTPKITKVTTGADQTISSQNPTTFSGKYTVDLLFPNDVKPSKVDVVVMKNGNAGNVKVLQSGVTTFPSTFTITGAQLTSLFGSPIMLGDKFDIGADVYTEDGKKYEAFPSNGAAGYGAGESNIPGSSLFVRYEAICTYIPAVYATGNYRVLADDWADYAVGDIIPVTQIDPTHISFKYLADNPQPIVIAIDPVTNGTSVAKQVYGSGYGAGWTYGPISAESVSDVRNNVAPCDSTVGVVLKHTVAAGSFGNNYIQLKRVN